MPFASLISQCCKVRKEGALPCHQAFPSKCMLAALRGVWAWWCVGIGGVLQSIGSVQPCGCRGNQTGGAMPWRLPRSIITAAIAQLGERQTEDLEVPSSILGRGICIVWLVCQKMTQPKQALHFQGASLSSGTKDPRHNTFQQYFPAVLLGFTSWLYPLAAFPSCTFRMQAGRRARARGVVQEQLARTTVSVAAGGIPTAAGQP